ncbi:MAG: hypothetical protein SNJ78_05540, partial [Spirochaetales bacterium]
LKALVIDTSSLIQIEKAGFLPALVQKVKLYTLPAVKQEYEQGSPKLKKININKDNPEQPFPVGVHILKDSLLKGGKANQDATSTPTLTPIPKPHSTDLALVELAHSRSLPLLSEDRKMLQKAELLGLEYFNALMMLEFLFYKRGLDPSRYEEHRHRLFSQSRYNKAVQKYGESLHTYIEKCTGV